MLNIEWKKLNENAIIPQTATEVASGYDFRTPYRLILKAGERILAPTEIAVQMSIDDYGFDCFIPWMKFEGCSGNAAKKGIAILGGVIDVDYSGHCKAILLNTSKEDVIFEIGDKLCQGIVHLTYKQSSVKQSIVDDFSSAKTERGGKGFGEMTGAAGDSKNS